MPTQSHPWGVPIWTWPIPVTPRPLVDGLRVDVAIVGAGFTGLATAHYVLQRFPQARVAVFEAQDVGTGASGRTGGLVLEDTAVGPLPGVGDCIATVQELVSSQHIACDLRVEGCWEIGRYGVRPSSPIRWADHGTLKVINAIPGGAFDPRKYLAGLTAVVERAGGQVFEHAPVTAVQRQAQGVRLTVAGHAVMTERAIFATNAWCNALLGLHDWTEDVHTIAVATEPLTDDVLAAIGWASHTPFYTLDHPYLWGRVTADKCAVIGAGLTGRGNIMHARVDAPDTAPLFAALEQRIRGLHPALHPLRITHRWMGPLCRTRDSKPIIASADDDGRVLVATGYQGHGVALSARVGQLLAAVLAGQDSLPVWSHRPVIP